MGCLVMEGFIDQDQDCISDLVMDMEQVELFQGGGNMISLFDMHGQACSSVLHTMKVLDVDVWEAC